MAHIGHPLAGDTVYGSRSAEKDLNGQCLHASELELTHPRSGERLHLKCPLPEEFTVFLSRMKAYGA